mgnify:CR=1 FL=1
MKGDRNIKQEILKKGENLNDYKFIYNEEGEEIGYSVNENYYYRRIAKEEDVVLGIELSEREVQEIIQGRQISDLEIQILELQIGGM